MTTQIMKGSVVSNPWSIAGGVGGTTGASRRFRADRLNECGKRLHCIGWAKSRQAHRDAMNAETIRVNLGPRSYDIAIATGDLAGVGPFARQRSRGKLALVVTDESVRKHAAT